MGWGGSGHVGVGWGGSCRGGVGHAGVWWGGSCRGGVGWVMHFSQFKFNILQVTLTQKIITHRLSKIHECIRGDVYE